MIMLILFTMAVVIAGVVDLVSEHIHLSQKYLFNMYICKIVFIIKRLLIVTTVSKTYV